MWEGLRAGRGSQLHACVCGWGAQGTPMWCRVEVGYTGLESGRRLGHPRLDQSWG